MTQIEAAFLFADLSGFTALAEAHGDVDAAAVAERFVAMATEALERDARVVKTIGDEVMIVAPSGAAAARIALELARRVDAEPSFPGVRAGLHHGTAVERAGDYFGTAVNVAARVAAHARAGQILCTEPVMHELEQEGLPTAPAGETRLRNLPRPWALFEVVDPDAGRSGLEVDPVCRMQLSREAAAGTLRHAGRVWHFCSLKCTRAFVEAPESYVG